MPQRPNDQGSPAASGSRRWTAQSPTARVLASIQSLAASCDLLPRGATVVVAVSGGQDSCALLHALAQLAPELDLRLHIAHLDHGFRGPASAADAEFVRELAHSLGVAATMEAQDVPGQARRLHLSAQVAARRARHAFLQRVAEAVGASRIALGHTRDDHVETVLLNVLRGTGVDGLRGLRPLDGRIARPLLEVSRADTAAYCREAGIAWREDASNASLAYKRNRVRTELLPELESYYNPDVKSALARLSRLAADDAELLNSISLDRLAACIVNRGRAEIVLSADTLLTLPPALRRRVLREAIRVVRGTLDDVDLADVERMMPSAAGADSCALRSWALAGGEWLVQQDGRVLRIARRVPAVRALPVEQTLPVPGEARLPQWGVAVRASYRACGGAGAAPSATASRSWIAPGAIVPPLVVRSRRPGDRLRPLGAPGSRKVQDILTDHKVPAGERDAVPIVADAAGILWVVGHALDERARIPAAESEIVVLDVRPLE